MNNDAAQKILKEVEIGYDLISGKFSQTRKNFWRGLEWLGDYVKEGDKVLDYGCGNGRLLELFKEKNIEYLGADTSAKLLEFAKQKHSKFADNFIKLDPVAQSLPFQSEFFNACYSIAVFHHFPSKKYRQKMAKELYRIAKKDGYVIVTVWNLYQWKYVNNLVRSWISKLRGKSELDWNDCLISFTDNEGRKFERFHHAFTKRELRNLFKNAGFVVESCRTVSGRNIVFVAKK